MSTKTSRLAHTIREQIRNGHLAPGDLMPSIIELNQIHGVSKTVSQAALALLEREGLITVRKGQKSIVRDHNQARFNMVLTSYETADTTHIPNADPWAAEVIKQGLQPSEEVRVSFESCPHHIAHWLDIATGQRVVVRRRERYAGDTLVQTADSYFPEDTAVGTLLTEPRPVHVPGGILASAGIHQTYRRTQIIPVIPDAAMRDRLRIPEGVAVNEITRIGYDSDCNPVRVMVTLAPGDKNLLIVEQHQGAHS